MDIVSKAIPGVIPGSSTTILDMFNSTTIHLRALGVTSFLTFGTVTKFGPLKSFPKITRETFTLRPKSECFLGQSVGVGSPVE